MYTKPKKQLGQHFLRNKDVLKKIVEAAKLTIKDTVLEVGPGPGNLTVLLAEKAGEVIAIEKDGELVLELKEKFKNHKNVEIIKEDILNTKNYKLPTKNYKLVANLPYYITSRFLRIFLSQTKFRPKLMVLMVQKEVAERIIAKNGKESLLSLSVKAYAKPEIIIKKVPKAYFYPPPEVDSAVIKLSIVQHSMFNKMGIDEEKFWDILHIAFRQKRKMLRRSIGEQLNLPDKFKNKRPEELSLRDWIHITA